MDGEQAGVEIRLKCSLGIFVSARNAQKALKLLREMELRLDGFQLQRTAEVVGIPLVHSPSPQDESILRRELGSFQLQEGPFEAILSKPGNLRAAARGMVPSHLISKVPRSLDIIGDIGIIELSSELESYSAEVGKAVLQVNPHVRLVLRKSGEVTGKFRTRGLRALAGSGGMETVHHEFACRYHLDVSSVYFNPRLAHERRRVAEQVKEDEVVVDMFAGVGPYSILVAKLQPRSRVYAVDINPSAIKYLKENTLANEVADRVIPLLGDARELSRSVLHGVADRVIMNLPSEAQQYLDAALHVLKSAGGLIHFYRFVERGEGLDSVTEQFRTSVAAEKREVESFRYCKVIREIAPSRVQVALDALVN
jgi:tRNA (guanine37-N1)-methyltransferase